MNEEKRHEVIELPDDGEYGSELVGRLVWEAYEVDLKAWERENPRPVEVEGSICDGKEENSSTDTRTWIQMGQKNREEKVDEKNVYL